MAGGAGGREEWRPLREALADWVDWDWAGYQAGVCLGLMPPVPRFGRAKHVFWSDHPVGAALLRVLDELAAAGVLQRRDEPDVQYRWNPAFRGTWE